MKTKAKISSRWLRFRALLIDIFLIYVPILYLFYFLLGSKEAFLNNHFITTLCTFLFGLIQAIFLTKKAQSPGLKAYDLYLIDINGQPLSLKIGSPLPTGHIVSEIGADYAKFSRDGEDDYLYVGRTIDGYIPTLKEDTKKK